MPTSKKAADKTAGAVVEAFQKALKAFWKKDYEKAQEQFQALLAAHGEARDVADRARAYLAVSSRHLDKKSGFKPKTLEEHVAYGQLLLNRGEFAEAQKVLAQAVQMDSRHEVAQYCLAAAAARGGDAALARKALAKAIDLSPESRIHARRDPDFESLREDEEVVALLEA